MKNKLRKCVKKVKTKRPKEGQLGVKHIAPRYHGDLKQKLQTHKTWALKHKTENIKAKKLKLDEKS